MRIETEAPLLVFGGPYSNLQALQALLDRARSLGIPPARMLCTGDVVAYCADAAAVLDLMMQAGIPTVMGNCEESLAQSAEDCGCGFEEGTACDLLSRTWFAHASRQVTPQHRAWMAALPRRIDLSLGRQRGGRHLAAIHGGATQVNRFIFSSAPEATLRAEIAATGAEGVLAGHCGLPFTRLVGNGQEDDLLWHNAGAIGMPADDGTPRAWFSLLEPQADGLRITHHALDYDHAAAAAAMRRAGLAEGYAAALCSGHWPSEDVLPAAERQARGRRLTPPALLWTASAAAASRR